MFTGILVSNGNTENADFQKPRYTSYVPLKPAMCLIFLPVWPACHSRTAIETEIPGHALELVSNKCGRKWYCGCVSGPPPHREFDDIDQMSIWGFDSIPQNVGQCADCRRDTIGAHVDHFALAGNCPLAIHEVKHPGGFGHVDLDG